MHKLITSLHKSNNDNNRMKIDSRLKNVEGKSHPSYPIWLKIAVDALSCIVANRTSNEYRAIWLALVWLAIQ